jgi:hypothetical protein
MGLIERCTCDRDTQAENMASPDCPAHGPDWQRVAARAVAEKVVLEQRLRAAVDRIGALHDNVKPLRALDDREQAYAHGYSVALSDALEALVRGQ